MIGACLEPAMALYGKLHEILKTLTYFVESPMSCMLIVAGNIFEYVKRPLKIRSCRVVYDWHSPLFVDHRELYDKYGFSENMEEEDGKETEDPLVTMAAEFTRKVDQIQVSSVLFGTLAVFQCLCYR